MTIIFVTNLNACDPFSRTLTTPHFPSAINREEGAVLNAMLGHTWTRYVLLLIACTWPAVQANTEIVNIQAVRSVAGGHQPPSAWYVHTAPAFHVLTPPDERPLFSAASRQQSFELEPIPLNFRPEDACTAGATHCPYDLWAILNFDDPVWVRSSKFTFRLSWPANVSHLWPLLRHILLRCAYSILWTVS